MSQSISLPSSYLSCLLGNRVSDGGNVFGKRRTRVVVCTDGTRPPGDDGASLSNVYVSIYKRAAVVLYAQSTTQ